MEPEAAETMTFEAASALAEKIRRYWHGRGKKDVDAWVTGPYSLEGQSVYVVRSNIDTLGLLRQ
jgi:hypothetical protein